MRRQTQISDMVDHREDHVGRTTKPTLPSCFAEGVSRASCLSQEVWRPTAVGGRQDRRRHDLPHSPSVRGNRAIVRCLPGGLRLARPGRRPTLHPASCACVGFVCRRWARLGRESRPRCARSSGLVWGARECSALLSRYCNQPLSASFGGD